jgi:hypothetical protein
MTFIFAGKESEIARACVGENRDTYRVLVREPQWKIPL